MTAQLTFKHWTFIHVCWFCEKILKLYKMLRDWINVSKLYIRMRGSRKFGRGGPTLICFFWGEQGSKTHQKGGNYMPASETPFKWHFAGGSIMAHIECWLGSFVIFRWSWLVLLGTIKFVIFQGGGGPRIHTYMELTLCLPVSSADNICKQFLPKSGPTKHRAMFWCQLLNTDRNPERNFWKHWFWKKKNQQMTKNHEKLFDLEINFPYDLGLWPWTYKSRFHSWYVI